MDEGKAKRLSAMWDACPSFLSAWVEKLPNSARVCVCYVPATLESQEAMTEAFLQGELDKAEQQGFDFIYSPLYSGVPIPRLSYKVQNPASGGSYWLFNDRLTGWYCSCPRCRRAGVCKHLIEAASRGLIEPPSEYVRKEAQKPTESNLESRSRISEETRNADWN
jgi:hypothetical protein